MNSTMIAQLNKPALQKAAREIITLYYASQGSELRPVIALAHILKNLELDEQGQTEKLIRILYLMRQDDVAEFMREVRNWQPGETVEKWRALFLSAEQGDLDAFKDLVRLAYESDSHRDQLKELGLACPQALTVILEIIEFNLQK